MATRSRLSFLLAGLGGALLMTLVAVATLSFVPASFAQRPGPIEPPHTQATLNVCDPITSNTTWLSGNVYLVKDCNLVVNSGATLTIQPGTIIKFGGTTPGYGSSPGSPALIIDGTLQALGTTDQPIVFTSLADDSRGGDTNANGPSSGQAGDWYGLLLRAGSTGTFEHVVIQYGGSGVFNAALGYGRAQLDVREASLSLRNGLISDGRTKGIYLEGTGLTPTIEDVTIRNNRSIRSDGYAIYQHTINQQPSYARLSLSGNDRDEVTIGGSGGALGQDVTLAGTTFGFECSFTVCQLVVPDGRILTVAPGTIVDFRRSFGLAVNGGGTLLAEGTVTNPVVFTSLRAAAGLPNEHWLGIWAKVGSTLRLNYCEIGYGSDGNFGMGGLEINTSDAEVRNCQIHHNQGYGLYLYSRSDGNGPLNVTLQNVQVTDNGGHGVMLEALINPLVLTWDGGSVSNNGWSGFTASTWLTMIQPTLRNLTIADNGVSGSNPEQRSGLYWSAEGLSPTLENLIIRNNPGDAIHWRCNGSITATGLQASGNGRNAIMLPGCTITSGQRWDLGAAGIPTQVWWPINVTSNGVLTLAPGTTLHFAKRDDGYPITLFVYDGGSLFAVGTPTQPVRLVGLEATAGSWVGIRAYNRASLTLRYCEIGHAGDPRFTDSAFNINGIMSGLEMQRCHLHHSGSGGFEVEDFFTGPTPLLRYNQFDNNANEAIINRTATPLDARQNYWGHPSGPQHPTLNPTGQGDQVGDRVLFSPWLAAPPSDELEAGSMQVQTGSPRLVSPGETVDYAVQYFNGRDTMVRDGLVVVQLPVAAEYLSSTRSGIYWPERHQVFWRLGDLPPGAEDTLGFQVRFAWGLPRDFRDGSLTMFSAQNENPDGLDRAAYAAFTPDPIQGVTLLTPGQRDAQLAAVPALQAAYNAALAEGYRYHSTATTARTQGNPVFQIVLVKPTQRMARIVALSDGKVPIYTITPTYLRIEDATGGTQLDLNTGARQFWGNWGTQTSLAAAELTRSGCSSTTCKRNCLIGMVSWNYIGGKVSRVLGWTAVAFFSGGGGAIGAVYEIGSTAKDLYACHTECQQDPSEHCCSEGQVRWSSGFVSNLTGTCYRERCNATVGMWVPDGFIPCTGLRARCVAGIDGAGGCKDCIPGGTQAQIEEHLLTVVPASPTDCRISSTGGQSRCGDLGLWVAKDPNEIFGPQGDLLPGEVLTYTITYENEGAGRAYGVYVVNELPAVFDETTVQFVHKQGVYLPESRELAWLIGELGPKGAADSTGILTYTVALKPGLPSGTVVANQAVVYFPSVPEETPTNTWINQVMPLVAHPQSLATNYAQPLNLTLSGREVSGLPLTYQIVEPPRGGVLSGTLPNLTYTPAEGFAGPDRFSFTVNNGTSTSRPAEVLIMVRPEGDTTPPQILWRTPVPGAQNVVGQATPVFSDTLGAIYGPPIQVGFSEALDPVSLTTDAVTLRRGSTPVTISLSFDAGANQLVIWPREPLAGGAYQVRLGTALTDLAGNPLAAEATWSFSVAGGGQVVYLPLVRR